MDLFNKLLSLSLSPYQMGQFSIQPGGLATPPAHKDPITWQVTNKLNLIPALRCFPTCTRNHCQSFSSERIFCFEAAQAVKKQDATTSAFRAWRLKLLIDAKFGLLPS